MSHSLNNCVNCLPGQKDVDVALKSIGESSKKLLVESVSRFPRGQGGLLRVCPFLCKVPLPGCQGKWWCPLKGFAWVCRAFQKKDGIKHGDGLLVLALAGTRPGSVQTEAEPTESSPAQHRLCPSVPCRGRACRARPGCLVTCQGTATAS